MKDLIYALRCSSAPGRNGYECKGQKCPYHTLEELPEKYKKLADFVKDGKYFVNNCDVDRICVDAADKLEEIMKAEDDLK